MWYEPTQDTDSIPPRQTIIWLTLLFCDTSNDEILKKKKKDVDYQNYQKKMITRIKRWREGYLFHVYFCPTLFKTPHWIKNKKKPRDNSIYVKSKHEQTENNSS